MPVVPVCLLEPLWVQFSALLPERPRVSPTHPVGCHRRRVPDRVVFEQVVAALVHGSGYERVASPGCSDATIRRRVKEWAALDLAELVHALALEADDRMLGLDLDDLAVDGCVTKAAGGGEVAARLPVDRGKQGLRRSLVTDATGFPLHVVAVGANWYDAPLLGPPLAGLAKLDGLPAEATVHLDRGYDGRPTRALLDELPCAVGVVLGDTQYNDPAIRDHCTGAGRLLVATRRGTYPHTDPGVEVRRIFHLLRDRAIENFNGQFKGIFDAHGAVPSRGLARTWRFALGAALVYQLTLLYRFEHGQELRVGLKAFLKAA